MLHEAGANQPLATEAWVGNQYCWVVWKLAGYEQTYPQQLQGKLLTPEVVFDQLKYRYAVLALAAGVCFIVWYWLCLGSIAVVGGLCIMSVPV